MARGLLCTGGPLMVARAAIASEGRPTAGAPPAGAPRGEIMKLPGLLSCELDLTTAPRGDRGAEISCRALGLLAGGPAPVECRPTGFGGGPPLRGWPGAADIVAHRTGREKEAIPANGSDKDGLRSVGWKPC